MPIFDTPITTDDANLKKVLKQNMPSLLILHDGTLDKPLEDALSKEAKKYAGDLLVVRVDAIQNPDTHLRYGEPALPALVTFTDAAKVKSDAVQVRPKDVRDHINHLLKDKPLPQQKSAAGSASHPLIVTDQTFRKEVLKSKIPVLVDFWATWCGPCHQIAPHIEQIAKDYAGQIKVVKLDVDRNQVISGRYNIQSIPTMIVFEGGQPAARVVGADINGLHRTVKQFV
ncbi:MAG: thioredoxin [Phototrophicaceae bacterium]